jgi:hypothetical protein
MSEGASEHFCLPKVAGRLGNHVINNVHISGCFEDWDQTIAKILPYVKTAALKQPDKILVVVDREQRTQCCSDLARVALESLRDGLLKENLRANVVVIISDKKFEAVVMADYELVDTLEILSRPVSPDFAPTLDGTDPKSLVDAALKPGKKYDKVRHGGALASKMRLNDERVLARSRSLRKLVKELTPTQKGSDTELTPNLSLPEAQDRF